MPIAFLLLLVMTAAPVLAQEPPAPPPACPCVEPVLPPPVWTGSFGAGLALTQGNKDTLNVNLSFDVARDPKTETIFAADGVYILATEGGEENVDRGLLNARVERLLTSRAYVFGQVGYVRDRFKDIDYLVAPTVGLGYKVIASEATTFAVDGSVGVALEKNSGVETSTDGAIAARERFTHRISTGSTFTQSATALWTMGDVGDALYTFSVGVAASVTTHVRLKLELQDVFKTRPTGQVAQSNDIALITAFVYTF